MRWLKTGDVMAMKQILDIDIDIDNLFPKIRTRQCHVKLFKKFSTVRWMYNKARTNIGRSTI